MNSTLSISAFDLCSWRVVPKACVFSSDEVLASELINLTDINYDDVTGLFTMRLQYPGTLITNLATKQLKSPLYLAALRKSSPNSISGFVCQVQWGLFFLSTAETGSPNWFQWCFYFNLICKSLTTDCSIIKSREPKLAYMMAPWLAEQEPRAGSVLQQKG